MLLLCRYHLILVFLFYNFLLFQNHCSYYYNHSLRMFRQIFFSVILYIRLFLFLEFFLLFLDNILNLFFDYHLIILIFFVLYREFLRLFFFLILQCYLYLILVSFLQLHHLSMVFVKIFLFFTHGSFLFHKRLFRIYLLNLLDFLLFLFLYIHLIYL